jgi:polysaccharide biosynthesis protein PslH
LIRAVKADSLFLEQPFGIIPAFIAAKLTGTELVIYSQNIEYNRFKSIGKWWWRLIYVIEHFAYWAADFILFIAYDDMQYAIKKMHKPPQNCVFATYGTYLTAIPTDNAEARQQVNALHGFEANEKLLIFQGVQSYQPNWEAVEEIVEKIAPILFKVAHFRYKILIIGGGLPDSFEKLKNYEQINVQYLGFVDDIDMYVKAADLMLNPIYSGGGVKTKVIEAISYNKSVVSYYTGSLGLYKEVCKNKLFITPDKDSETFVAEILRAINTPSDSTEEFYNEYYWGNIVKSYPFGS